MGRNADFSWKYWVCCYYLACIKHPQSTYNAQRKHSSFSQRTHMLKLGRTQRLGPWHTHWVHWQKEYGDEERENKMVWEESRIACGLAFSSCGLLPNWIRTDCSATWGADSLSSTAGQVMKMSDKTDPGSLKALSTTPGLYYSVPTKGRGFSSLIYTWNWYCHVK